MFLMHVLLFPQCFLLFQTHFTVLLFRQRAKTAVQNVSLPSTCRAIKRFCDFFPPWLYFLPKTLTFFCDILTSFLDLTRFSLSAWRHSAFFLNLWIMCFICFPLLSPAVTIQQFLSDSSCLGWHDKVVASIIIKNAVFWFVSVYSSSLPVAHLSNTPRRQFNWYGG